MHRNSTPPNRRCQSTHLKTLSADILGEENISKVCKPQKKYVQFNKMHDGGKKPRQDLSSFPVPKRKSTEFFCFYFRLLSTEFVFTGLFSGQMRWHTFLFRRLGHRGKFSITTDCSWKVDGLFISQSCRPQASLLTTKLSQVVKIDKYWQSVRCTCTKGWQRLTIWQQLHHDDRYYEEFVGDLCNVPPSTFVPEVPGYRKENPNGDCLCSTRITPHIQKDWALNILSPCLFHFTHFRSLVPK